MAQKYAVNHFNVSTFILTCCGMSRERERTLGNGTKIYYCVYLLFLYFTIFSRSGSLQCPWKFLSVWWRMIWENSKWYSYRINVFLIKARNINWFPFWFQISIDSIYYNLLLRIIERILYISQINNSFVYHHKRSLCQYM